MKLRILLLSFAASTACHTPNHDDVLPNEDARIQPAKLLAHIQELASDRYEGRAPASPGEELTVRYLTQQFQALGLRPGNPNGSWVQEVPLVGFTSTPTIGFAKGAAKTMLTCPDEAVALSRWYAPSVDVQASEVVFVGYGVVAPEYQWDDYKGLDTKGKTLIMLVNDPPVVDPKDPKALDENVFRGKAMTYYGRWTYKYEIAAEKGAAAVLIVHDTEAAGYPFDVVKSSWGHENFDLENEGGNKHRARVEGWLRGDKAKELFASAGLDFDALKKSAATRDFKPVALSGLTGEFHVANLLRPVHSRNVIAKLRGSDTLHADECVIYSAHWDHLGLDPKLEGDGIYNGAIDNASGVAGLLEIARSFASHELHTPRRTILFLAVTAEEKGLLGSRWYAEHPLYPLEKTLCDINMDSLNPFGRTRDIISIGKGQTTLDGVLEELAHRRERVVRADTKPEKGFYFRSDHFEFARVGVPALYADSGEDLVGKPAGEGKRLWEDYTEHHYHKPSDEVRADWDLTGAAEDLELLAAVGRTVANAAEWPQWKPSSEFRARREAALHPAAEKAR